MDKKQKSALVKAGINVDAAINRFMGRDDMFEKFLLMFLNDKNYPGLLVSLEERDIQKAFAYAHTMKGVIANLSIDTLTEAIVPIVEELRVGSMEHIGPALTEYATRYEKVKKVVQANFEQC